MREEIKDTSISLKKFNQQELLTIYFQARFYPVCWAYNREQETTSSLCPPNWLCVGNVQI